VIGITLWVFSYTLSLTLLMMTTLALDYWVGLGCFEIQVVDWKGDFWEFLRDFFNMKKTIANEERKNE